MFFPSLIVEEKVEISKEVFLELARLSEEMNEKIKEILESSDINKEP